MPNFISAASPPVWRLAGSGSAESLAAEPRPGQAPGRQPGSPEIERSHGGMIVNGPGWDLGADSPKGQDVDRIAQVESPAAPARAARPGVDRQTARSIRHDQ